MRANVWSIKAKLTLIVAASLSMSCPTHDALFAEEPPAGNLLLKTADDGETGLKKIIEDWAAAELQKQGGKYQDHGWWPWGLTALDFDNDGDLDLVPTHHGGAGGLLLRNNLKETGKLTFTDITQEAAGDTLRHLMADDRPMIWDFDGDGWLDIAGFSDESKPWSYFNKEGKKLEPIADFSFSPVSHATEVKDLNSDGFPDLYTSARHGVTRHIYDQAKRKFVMEKIQEDAKGPFPEGHEAWFAELKAKKNNRFLGCGLIRDKDLNGDGLPDIVASVCGGYGADSRGRYYLADKDGKFSDKTAGMGLPEMGVPIFTGDLTGDGAPEVLVAMDDMAGIYVNDGKGKFTRKEGDLTKFLTKRDSYPLRAIPVDLDNDGDTDLVVTAPRGGSEEVHENLGNGEFRKVLGCSGWDANPIVICDINNDGLLDVCVGGSKNTISLHLNATPNPGNRVEICPRMDKPNPFAVGAKVEVFKDGDIGKDGARPVREEMAHPDATPVFVGLGGAKTFDLRVTFPGPSTKTVELKGLAAGKRWKITPDGKADDR